MSHLLFRGAPLRKSTWWQLPEKPASLLVKYRSSNILCTRLYFHANRNEYVFSECRGVSVYHQQQISSKPSVHLPSHTCFVKPPCPNFCELLSCVLQEKIAQMRLVDPCANAFGWFTGFRQNAWSRRFLSETLLFFGQRAEAKAQALATCNVICRFFLYIRTERTVSMSRLQAEKAQTTHRRP